MTKGRIASALVAFIYLAVAFMNGGVEAVFVWILLLISPMVCIWWSDGLGNFTGTVRGRVIDVKTPGCLIAFFGWLLLLLPAILEAILLFKRNG